MQDRIPAEHAEDPLLSPPAQAAITYNGRTPPLQWLRPQHNTHLYDISTGERIGAKDGREISRAIAARLSAISFVSVPVRYASELAGRLYIASRDRGFDYSDVQFLLQVVENVLPVIQNIRLVDRLASDAAEHERQRIARDIHDTVIQPYIGLQMGLSATHQRLETGVGRGSPDSSELSSLVREVTEDLGRLIELTDGGIADLRSFVQELSGKVERDSSLLPAVRRFVGKFSEATGINVCVTAPNEIHLNDRLAAQVFQMVAEGLSNIRRHTQAERAAVDLATQDGLLILRVENDGAEAPVPFMPGSIMARAEALGGSARVEYPQDRSTAVIVEIPL